MPAVAAVLLALLAGCAASASTDQSGAGGSDPDTAGGHDASVLEVLAGRCDVGLADDSMVGTTLPQSAQLKPRQLNILWRSDMPRSTKPIRQVCVITKNKNCTTGS